MSRSNRLNTAFKLHAPASNAKAKNDKLEIMARRYNMPLLILFLIVAAVAALLTLGGDSATETTTQRPDVETNDEAESPDITGPGAVDATALGDAREPGTTTEVTESDEEQTTIKVPSAKCTTEAKTSAELDSKVRSAKAGTVLCVRGGNYTMNIMDLSLVGTAAKPVVIQNYPGESPIIRQAGTDLWVLKLLNSKHVTIQGLTLEGNDKSEASNDDDVGTGLGADKTNFLTLRNNVVNDFGGGGISTTASNNILIEGNTASNNGHSSCVQPSGISVLSPQSSPAGDFSGEYEVIIRGNTANNNSNQRIPSDPWHQGRTSLSWYPEVCNTYIGITGEFNRYTTDGNCIIIDVANNWSGRALIENNVCSENGGRAVAMTRSSNATIRNNTFYRNSRPVTLHSPGAIDGLAEAGEIGVNNGNNILIENNVIWARPDRQVYTEFNGSSTRKNNIEVTSNAEAGFINPGTNFGLKASSPLIDKSSNNSPATDKTGSQRSGTADVGAYELAS